MERHGLASSRYVWRQMADANGSKRLDFMKYVKFLD
jgi:hypothetical protein